jgi:hypothetical protein
MCGIVGLFFKRGAVNGGASSAARRFAADSLLEGDGFEASVPLGRGSGGNVERGRFEKGVTLAGDQRFESFASAGESVRTASTWCTIGRRALDGLWRDHLPPARNGPGAFRDPRPASGATCPQDRGPPAQEGPEPLSQNLRCLARSRSAPSANLCPSDAAGAPCSNSAIASAGAPR